MANYKPPITEMLFLFNMFNAERTWHYDDYLKNNLNLETVVDILNQCAELIVNQIHPLNRLGDETGLTFKDGEVITPPGFQEAYKKWCSQGWTSLAGSPNYGGMGLPNSLAMCIGEMLFAANCSFALYPELSSGAAHLINLYASEQIKSLYLSKLYSGMWTATMCLTESQAGSDLSLIKTSAIPKNDGTFSISGEKIFISGGEHDLSKNIVHLVLAKLPDAPEGIKGISVFLIPKYLINDKGNVVKRNTVFCTGIEKKMGIHAAATCVMQFDDAKGYIIGEPHNGLAVMFSMMNHERLSISMQSLGLGEASYQTAASYAKERIQGMNKYDNTTIKHVPIVNHGDIKRMLLTMKALNEGSRAFAMYVSMFRDQSMYSQSSEERTLAKAMVSLLTPTVKAFISDMGLETCILGQQVLGGYGYIRDWGQEQHVRDARIAQIYEGTNGIQATDLLERKILHAKHNIFDQYIKIMKHEAENNNFNALKSIQKMFNEAVDLLESVTEDLKLKSKENPQYINAYAVDYLHLFGYVSFAFLWFKTAKYSYSEIEQKNQNSSQQIDNYHNKLTTASFYFKKILPRIHGLEKILQHSPNEFFNKNVSMF